MARAAGVLEDDGEKAQVRRVTNRRLDAHLERDPGDGERDHAAVTERELQRRPLERGHGQLVEDRLARARLELRRQREAGRVAEEPRLHQLRAVHPLPGHGHPVLRCAHQLEGQRQVPGEEHPHPGVPGGREGPLHPLHDPCAVGDLPDDADLHVVDQERHPLGVDRLLERAGIGKLGMCPL